MRKIVIVRRIVGDSMLPRLKSGQIVLGWGFGKPKPGSVVIISHDGLEKIKRIDHVDSGQVYVLGDNATASTDSRQFGSLPASQIVARLVWPRL